MKPIPPLTHLRPRIFSPVRNVGSDGPGRCLCLLVAGAGKVKHSIFPDRQSSTHWYTTVLIE